MLQQPHQLVGLAAFRDENRHVVAAHDAKVTVNAIHRM